MFYGILPTLNQPLDIGFSYLYSPYLIYDKYCYNFTLNKTVKARV